MGVFMGLRHEGSEARGRVIDISAEGEDRSARRAGSAAEARIDHRAIEAPTAPLQILAVQPLARIALTYKPTAGTPRAADLVLQRDIPGGRLDVRA